MSLDDLTKLSPNKKSNKIENQSRSASRSRTWMLPLLLLLGFITILALLFGKRLLPATKVQIAPVITIRTGEDEKKITNSVTQPSPNTPPISGDRDIAKDKGSLLFQASGWVEPDPYTTYVPALVNGVLDKVLVLEGQAVKKGELLATLIDDNATFAVLEAVQNYSATEKQIEAHCSGVAIIDAEVIASKRKIDALKLQVEESSDHYERLKKLTAGAVSQQQVVKARLDHERRQAVLDEALSELPRLDAKLKQIEAERLAMLATLSVLGTKQKLAQLALDRTKIVSPMDGIVLRLHAAPGRKRMLAMDDANSAVIAELYDPAHLQARIDVPLNEAAALSVGQIVEMNSDLLPNKIFTGKVTRINGQADLQRNTLQVKVSIKNPDPRLRPDMLVRAKFYNAGSQQPDAAGSSNSPKKSNRLSIYVPEKALVSESLVWVVAPDNTAEKRNIKLGSESRDGHRLVLDGLRSGESVILPPFTNIQPGTRLELTVSTH